MIKNHHHPAYTTEFMAGLCDGSIDQVIGLDMSMQVVYANPRCLEIWLMTRDDIDGRIMELVFPVLYAYAEIKVAIDYALLGGKSFVGHDIARGSYEHHIMPVRDASEKLLGVQIVIHDISVQLAAADEIKRLNRILIRKNKIIEQNNAEYSAFAYVATHDLKEPLRKIYTFIDYIIKNEERLTESGQVYFRGVQAAARRMGMLTDDLWAFTALNDHINKPKEPVDTGAVLLAVLDTIGRRIDETKARIECSPMPVIAGHRHMIEYLIRQMLSNALKFQEPGNVPHISITAAMVNGIDIDHHAAIWDMRYMRLSFADNGVGFDKKYSDKVFHMFQRLHDGKDYDGHGFGLALCRKIAQMHGGFITVDSEPGRGSTFHCYFSAGFQD